MVQAGHGRVRYALGRSAIAAPHGDSMQTDRQFTTARPIALVPTQDILKQDRRAAPEGFRCRNLYRIIGGDMNR